MKWKHFRDTGLLYVESTVHRWIPRIKASDAELWCLLWSAPKPTVEQLMETPVIWEAIALIMTSLECRVLAHQERYWIPIILHLSLLIVSPDSAQMQKGHSKRRYAQDTICKWNAFLIGILVFVIKFYWRLSYWGRHRAHYDRIAMLFHTCGKLPLRSYQYSDNVKHIEGSYSPVDTRLNPAMFGFTEGVSCSGRRLTTQYTSITEHCSDTGRCVHYSGITWASWCFKTPITRLFMFASFKTKNLPSLVICEGNGGFPINKGH